jgi:glycyl-tRNA synthetase
MNSADILSLCKRRGFIWPAYEIYGGIAGLYDYGPLGTAMKNNITNAWRKAYTLGEGFIEIDSNTIGPEAVFKASGHVDQFSDKLVTCTQCKKPFRADHLLQDLHPNPGTLSLIGIVQIAVASCPGRRTSISCSRPPSARVPPAVLVS